MKLDPIGGSEETNRPGLRQLLAAGNGAAPEVRRSLPPRFLQRPLDPALFVDVDGRMFEIEMKIRNRLRSTRRPSSQKVANDLNAAHGLTLSESYVEAHREQWGAFKIEKPVVEKLGPLRHSAAVRILLATGDLP